MVSTMYKIPFVHLILYRKTLLNISTAETSEDSIFHTGLKVSLKSSLPVSFDEIPDDYIRPACQKSTATPNREVVATPCRYLYLILLFKAFPKI